MSRFGAEVKIIPNAAWTTAALVTLGFAAGLAAVLVQNPAVPLALRVILPPVTAVLLGTYVLVIGYINGDARRRGMRHVLWTLLVIFIPNGIGIILYFVLRDPMPVRCTRCEGLVQTGHAFCPHCGAGLKPACPKCGRAVEMGWSNCPYCGAKLA